MEPHARTSTMLNPTGSLDLRRLTYSFALASPASKCVCPFCDGTCLATFSLWKLKNTNLPRNKDNPVLKLITRGALSSALTPQLNFFLVAIGRQKAALLRASVGLLRGLRPWKVGVENRVEAMITRLFRLKCCRKGWSVMIGYSRLKRKSKIKDDANSWGGLWATNKLICEEGNEGRKILEDDLAVVYWFYIWIRDFLKQFLLLN